MQRKDVERVWPERLKIRDTGLHDDLGGPGQRIYTTAGRGYERVEYVRADLYAALLAERDTLQRQLNDLRNGWANSVKAHAALLAERDTAFAAGQEEMREWAAGIAQGKHDMALKFMSQYLKDYDGNTDSLIIAKQIRALPIKPRP